MALLKVEINEIYYNVIIVMKSTTWHKTFTKCAVCLLSYVVSQN